MNNPAGTVNTQTSGNSYAPVMLFGKKKKEQIQPVSTSQEAPPAPKQKKPTGTAIQKYEIAEDKAKFYNAKGFFKKRWVITKEFPISELTAVECLGNWLSLTWNGTAYPFILKRKGETFAKLYEQIQVMREEQQKKRVQDEKVALRRTDLLSLLTAVLPVVDTSFDVLMVLHAKRVDWALVEDDAQPFGAPFSFRAETLAPLDLDFSKAAAAVKNQTAKETSKETLNILKALHGYFTASKPEDDLTGNPNFGHIKAAVLAYYTINDLMLAKMVGEKDSKKEVAYLEETLNMLSNGSNVKADAALLMTIVERVMVEVEREGAISDARRLFREQLKLL